MLKQNHLFCHNLISTQNFEVIDNTLSCRINLLLLLLYFLFIYIGLTGTEILFSQVITQFTVIFGQAVMVLIVCFPIFRVTCEGDIGWITVLTVLTGLCGMCFGNLVIHYIHQYDLINIFFIRNISRYYLQSFDLIVSLLFMKSH